jgi:hypothetical protein
VTPDAGALPGGLSPAEGSGPRGLLAYRSAQGRWVLAAMIAGSSVAGIDSTAVAVALPAIGRNLHAGFGALQWTVTSYTLTLASLILLAGSLSDRWGRRRVFLAGLGWFTLASVLCAAAPGIGWLIAYTNPVQFRSSFTQISWICAAAFTCAAVLTATFITGPRRPAPARRPALIQTPVPHLACPVAFGHAPRQTRKPDSSQASHRFRAADTRPRHQGRRQRHPRAKDRRRHRRHRLRLGRLDLRPSNERPRHPPDPGIAQ